MTGIRMKIYNIVEMKTTKPLWPYIIGYLFVGGIVLSIFWIGLAYVLSLVFPFSDTPIFLWSVANYTFLGCGLYLISFWVFEFFHRQRPPRGSLRKDYTPPPKEIKSSPFERRVPWEWSFLISAVVLLNVALLFSLLGAP
ncbi:MAG: hypothetical protein ACFFCZ_11125 [Promethearchaeota archaeon]